MEMNVTGVWLVWSQCWCVNEAWEREFGVENLYSECWVLSDGCQGKLTLSV